MNILTKYDLNDFYCGYITIDKVTAAGKEARMVNGTNSKYIDMTKNYCSRYKTMFSLFLKINEKNYYCVLDNKIYNIKELNPKGFNYADIEPFKDYLPKYHSNIQEKISTGEALNYFKVFHKYNYMCKLLNNDLLPIKNLYIGNLNICSSKQRITTNEKDYINFPDSLVLFNNHAKLSQMFVETENEYSFNYYSFKALLLREEYGTLCLNNGKLYTKGTLDNNKYYPTEISSSYYEYLNPLESLDSKDTIELKGALKRFRHK